MHAYMHAHTIQIFTHVHYILTQYIFTHTYMHACRHMCAHIERTSKAHGRMELGDRVLGVGVVRQRHDGRRRALGVLGAH